MSRKKISEYRAKTLIYRETDQEYEGFLVNLLSSSYDHITEQLPTDRTYVVKVDQAIKKRNTQNLVVLDVIKDKISAELTRFKGLGYTWALVEEYKIHEKHTERFVALDRTSDGVVVSYSEQGGIDIENNANTIRSVTVLDDHEMQNLDVGVNINIQLKKLLTLFNKSHMTYLEINPFYIDSNSRMVILDAAVEVDSSSEFFIDKAWSHEDFRDPKKELSEYEQAIEELAATSPSSLSLKVLNPNGSIFLLLSGGGASVVVADEISNLGYHNEMANYGEYSGNPTEEETYLYAKQVIKLLLRSSSQKKVLVIAGGVANFTDVAKTFKGIIKAISEMQDDLRAQSVTVFVRRGGPNQEAGLREMRDFLTVSNIENSIHGPDLSLSEIVRLAVERVKND